MRGPFISLKMRLLGWLQKQCVHPPELVSYDISEGWFKQPVSWCRICGATKLGGGDGFDHSPRADWWIDDAKRLAEAARSAS